MASAFVSITDIDGVVHRVNPDQVEQITENTTLSQTLVHLDNKFVITTATARATVQAALESGAAVEIGGTGTVAVANGGTGADNAADARTNLSVVGLPTFTTKGDIVVATGAGAVERLAVGTEGQIPVARSAATGGWAWETPTGAGRVGSRVLFVPTGTGSLVSTTPDADANASTSIAWSSTIAGYKSGFTFTSAGATGTNKHSAWKLNIPNLPNRYVVEADLGNRTANIQPYLFFVYGSIIHTLTPYRVSTNSGIIGINGRNNSTTSVNYTTGTPVIGMANDYGGKIRIEVDMSAMDSGPLGTYTVTTYGSSEFGGMRNSFVGHFTTVDASWAALTNYIAIGCSEITTTGDTTNISNIVVYKHPLDE